MLLILAGLVGCGSTTDGAGRLATGSSVIGRHSVVAFIGDSYTVGAGASSPAHRWSSLVAQHFGWVETNLGVGGTGYAASPPYLGRVGVAAAVHPAAVVVSGGFNDLVHGVTGPAFQQAAFATFAALRRALPHARIVAIRPFYPAGPSVPAVAAFAAYVRQAVVAVGGVYLDIGSPLRGKQAAMAPDQVHPNDVGYQLLAQAIEGAVAAHR